MDFFFDIAMGKPIWMWLTFIGIVGTLLAFDLGVLHRKTRAISIKESLYLSAFYIGIALLFVWRRLGDVHHATELPSLFEPVNGEDDLDDLDDDATRPMVRDPMVRDDDDLLVLTPSRDPDDSKDPPDSV
jgi:hypothetical protein